MRNTKTRSKDTTTPTKVKDELNPELRLQQVETSGKTMQMYNTVDVMAYYDSSINIIKKADMQYSNDQLETALVTYLKFLDLFRDKILKHVDFKRVPLTVVSCNQYYQRHADKRVKELRAKLLERYKDTAALHQALKSPGATKKDRRQSDKQLKYIRLRSMSSIDPIDRSAFDVKASRLLRTVVVPKQLPTIFQIVTQKIHTAKFSTCGTLMGRLQHNEYLVTHLVIPCQDAEGQEVVHGGQCQEYAKEHQLLLLGWIHSHRPASCYMSSNDLHAQWQLQRNLPEAIAIVCAPSITQVEFYALLKFGMEYIGRCGNTGTHAHYADKPLYGMARHVRVVYDQQFEVVDLVQGHESRLC